MYLKRISSRESWTPNILSNLILVEQASVRHILRALNQGDFRSGIEVPGQKEDKCRDDTQEGCAQMGVLMRAEGSNLVGE